VREKRALPSPLSPRGARSELRYVRGMHTEPPLSPRGGHREVRNACGNPAEPPLSPRGHRTEVRDVRGTCTDQNGPGPADRNAGLRQHTSAWSSVMCELPEDPYSRAWHRWVRAGAGRVCAASGGVGESVENPGMVESGENPGLGGSVENPIGGSSAGTPAVGSPCRKVCLQEGAEGRGTWVPCGKVGGTEESPAGLMAVGVSMAAAGNEEGFQVALPLDESEARASKRFRGSPCDEVRREEPLILQIQLLSCNATFRNSSDDSAIPALDFAIPFVLAGETFFLLGGLMENACVYSMVSYLGLILYICPASLDLVLYLCFLLMVPVDCFVTADMSTGKLDTGIYALKEVHVLEHQSTKMITNIVLYTCMYVNILSCTRSLRKSNDTEQQVICNSRLN
jgi:hypothetical protein